MYGYNFDFYEPGEDSYAFLDFLKMENIKNKFILDMGCSTCILTDLLKINNCVISLDKNIKALNYTPGFSNRINGPEVMAATGKNEKKEKNSWPFCCRCRLWDSSFTRFGQRKWS